MGGSKADILVVVKAILFFVSSISFGTRFTFALLLYHCVVPISLFVAYYYYYCRCLPKQKHSSLNNAYRVCVFVCVCSLLFCTSEFMHHVVVVTVTIMLFLLPGFLSLCYIIGVEKVTLSPSTTPILVLLILHQACFFSPKLLYNGFIFHAVFLLLL